MAAPSTSTPEICDVCVVGAGLAGAAAATAFARAGFSCVSIGALERAAHGRTVALFGDSLRLMGDLGVQEEVERRGAPLRELRIIDDSGSLFQPRPVEFRCGEIGLDAFGWNIENAALADILARAMGAEPRLARLEAHVDRFAWDAESVRAIAHDRSLAAARLVIGADGRGSPTRRAAGISARTHAYGQSALTLFLCHDRPHEHVSTEFHTREGPFTLVPLPAATHAPFRSSLVWVMSDAEARRRAGLDDFALGREIERQSKGILGALRIEGERGLFPMIRQSAARLTATRIALIGDAAHVFPPIGAQGLNLGLRDVEGLVAATRDARRLGEDIGGAAALGAYARARAPDIAERMLAVDGLNVSLIAHHAPVDALRAAGLTALRLVGPLRRFAMREGLSPQWAR